ncbi:MAG: Crp/Fnr family transcriptional regulator [Epsilonproteobacteria bacterium]|nr:Crp/Fnr family transcriptional regulator [Campylobacterota bacterium]
MLKSVVDILHEIDFFNSLTPEEYQKVSDISTLSSYSKNSILYYEDDTINRIYFLVSGLIKVYKLDKFDNEIFLYHIYKNNMISELTTIDSKSIYCFSNAEFIEEGVVLSIDFEKFKKEFLQTNILTIKFIEEILAKTHQLQCIVNRELVFDATAKVAYMLSHDLPMFNKLKRQEVSFMLHIQPETLSRVIKRLQRNGIIGIENSDIKIIDADKLQAVFKGNQNEKDD